MSNYTNTQRIELADKFITSISDKTFQSEAYIDYLDKKRQNTFQILEILGFVQDIPVVDADEVPQIPDDYQSIINNKLIGAKLAPHSRIYLSSGPTLTLLEFFEQACTDFRDMMVVNGNFRVDLDSKLIYTFNDIGQGTVTHSYSSFIDEIKQSAYSLTCHIAALKAASTVNLSEKINIYKDKIEEYFSGVFTDISNSYAYYKSALEKSTSVTDLIHQVSIDTNLDTLGDVNSSDVTLENTNIYDYTGTTPITAMSVNCGIIGTSIKVGLTALKGVISAVGALASKFVISPISQFVNAGFNPIDLNYIEGAEQFTIDKFQYKISEVIDYNFNSEADSSMSFDAYDDICESLINKSIYMNTWFAEYIIVFNDYQRDPISGFDNSCNYVVYRKYKSLTDLSLLSFLQIVSAQKANFTVTWDSLTNAISLLNSFYPEYNSDVTDEKAMVKGFVNAMVMEAICMKVLDAVLRFNYNQVGSLVSLPNYMDHITDFNTMNTQPCFQLYSQKFITDNNNVTNSDYLDVSCGYYNGEFHSTSSLFVDPGGSISEVWPIVRLFTFHQLYEYNYPLDFPFLPYSNSNRNFGTSKFSIKTDADNIAAFSNMAQTVFNAAIVVAVGLIAIRGINKFKLKQAQKRYNRKLNAQVKTILGEPLTMKEKRAFMRDSNTASLFDKIGSGLTKSDTSELPNDVISSLNTIISLIK